MDPTTTDGPLSFLTADHRACDALWGELEEALDADDATRSGSLWSGFDAALRRHLAMEEEVIFPAFQDATGMRGFGPVEVMKMEHTQIRALLDRMGREADGSNWQGLMDEGDTLMMLIGQHNAKEEGILYPMLDMHLRGGWAGLTEKLTSY